jgi:hypothetical protein
VSGFGGWHHDKQFDGGVRFGFTRRVIGENMIGLTVNCRMKRVSHLAKARWQRSLDPIQDSPADCGDGSE